MELQWKRRSTNEVTLFDRKALAQPVPHTLAPVPPSRDDALNTSAMGDVEAVVG